MDLSDRGARGEQDRVGPVTPPPCSGDLVFLCGALLSITLLIAAASAAAQQPRKRSVVRVGKIEAFSRDERSPSWPIDVGRIQGFFDEEGIEIQFVLTDGFESQTAGLVARQFEIGHQSTPQIILEIEKGAPLVLFMADQRPPNLVLVADPSIKSISDLRHKKVGYSGIVGQDYLPLIRMLSGSHVRPSEYSLVGCGSVEQRLGCLKQKRVSAALLNQVLAQEARKVGFAILGNAEPYVAAMPISAAAVRRDWAAAHGDLLMGYIRAYSKSVDWLLEPANHNDAVAIIQDKGGVNRATALQLYQTTTQRLVPGANLTAPGVREVLDAMIDAGQLQPGNISVERYLDLTFLARARSTPATKGERR